MKLVPIIEFLRGKLKLLVWICFVLLAALVCLDVFLVDKEHAHTSWERRPAFWAVFGFIACVVIILGSKWFGHLGIMTRENYYDE